MTIRKLKYFLLVSVFALSLGIAACSSDDSGDDSSSGDSSGGGDLIQSNPDNSGVDLSIGSKNFTEQIVLGEIYAQGLKAAGYSFDMAYTSVLKRAIRTLWIVLDEMNIMWIPVHRSWRLNERHYGNLQGINKRETTERYGHEQVQKWRRSYDVRPPSLAETDSRHPRFDLRYSHLKEEELPSAESLTDTLNRFLPYWHEKIVPSLTQGQIPTRPCTVNPTKRHWTIWCSNQPGTSVSGKRC